MKRKIEAWGVVGKTGELLRVAVASHCGTIWGLKGEHLVRLVEADPTAEAVVRAAGVFLRNPTDENRVKLNVAHQRHLKRKKEKRLRRRNLASGGAGSAR